MSTTETVGTTDTFNWPKKNEARKALEMGIEDGLPLDAVMKLYAFYILECNKGNKVHAAEVLKIDRRTLQRWEKANNEALEAGRRAAASIHFTDAAE